MDRAGPPGCFQKTGIRRASCKRDLPPLRAAHENTGELKRTAPNTSTTSTQAREEEEEQEEEEEEEEEGSAGRGPRRTPASTPTPGGLAGPTLRGASARTPWQAGPGRRTGKVHRRGAGGEVRRAARSLELRELRHRALLCRRLDPTACSTRSEMIFPATTVSAAPAA
ncbi:unnamed protein product [Prorocentrum cordatum]|uniref:Uncharacterized protein n=1 Tax=Prorocentrum cordatum TaxID=2364126 RepID=A0ABN9U791_9DINO|nr:unnamed protein product [Polarella glacialis]